MLKLLPKYRGVYHRFFSVQTDFEAAQKNLKKLSEEPDVDTKLQIYALFKQATVGDVSGSRPGMMDFAGRAKFDSWNKVNGISKEDAMAQYVSLIGRLSGSEAAAEPNQTVGNLTPVKGLDYSIDGKVFKITLNRPSKFNALTLDMYKGIINGLKEADNNPSVACTVITASGNYFCSGNDLSNFAGAASLDAAGVKKMAEEAREVLREYVAAYIDHKKPLIALVNGPAIGIAVTVLPLFDLVFSSNKATFNTPFAAIGQSPEGASSYSFPLMMGPLKAAEVLLFGKKLSAEDAHREGLVNEVIPEGEFFKVAWERVHQYSHLPPQSLTINKVLLRSFHKDALHKVNNVECDLICERWQSKECASAIAAFLSRSKK